MSNMTPKLWICSKERLNNFFLLISIFLSCTDLELVYLKSFTVMLWLHSTHSERCTVLLWLHSTHSERCIVLLWLHPLHSLTPSSLLTHHSLTTHSLFTLSPLYHHTLTTNAPPTLHSALRKIARTESPGGGGGGQVAVAFSFSCPQKISKIVENPRGCSCS